MGNKGKSKEQNKEVPSVTNGWDVLKSIIDGLFDFISLNKVAALGLFWYIIRDMIFVFHLPDDYDYASHLLNSEFLEYLFNNENILVVVESTLIVVLVIACFALILHSIFLRKEINRISEARSNAIHGKENIKKHTTSK